MLPCFQLTLCVAIVDHPATRDRVVDPRIPDSFGRDLGQVAVDDYDVCEFPGCQRPFLVFLKGGIGCTTSVRAQRLFDRDFLFRHPAAGMLVVERPARHGCVNPLERRRRCDRPVAAERQPSAAILERAKCVSGPRALGSDYFLSPTTVVDGMIRLHARNDAKLSEARDISWCDMLRVLDPKAPILFSILALYSLEDIELEIDSTVPDSVDDDVQIRFVGVGHGGIECAIEHLRRGIGHCGIYQRLRVVLEDSSWRP